MCNNNHTFYDVCPSTITMNIYLSSILTRLPPQCVRTKPILNLAALESIIDATTAPRQERAIDGKAYPYRPPTKYTNMSNSTLSKRKHFTPDFKRMIIDMLKKEDKPASVIALEFDIPMSQLYRWEKDIQLHGDAAFQKNKKSQNSTPIILKNTRGSAITITKNSVSDSTTTDYKSIVKLEREIEFLKEENSTLRKTISILSRD